MCYEDKAVTLTSSMARGCHHIRKYSALSRKIFQYITDITEDRRFVRQTDSPIKIPEIFENSKQQVKSENSFIHKTFSYI